MYLPIMLNIIEKDIVIVGGGKIGLRKANKILDSGGKVKCISLEFDKEFFDLPDVTLIHKEYDKNLIIDAYIVLAATSDEELNNRILKDCHSLGKLCSTVTNSNLSDYIFQSSLNQGDLYISASTCGKSPILAKSIIERLKEEFDESYKQKVYLLGEIRKKVIKSELLDRDKKKLLTKIINLDNEELQNLLNKYEIGVCDCENNSRFKK